MIGKLSKRQDNVIGRDDITDKTGLASGEPFLLRISKHREKHRSVLSRRFVTHIDVHA
jgi:hypothetical protein